MDPRLLELSKRLAGDKPLFPRKNSYEKTNVPSRHLPPRHSKRDTSRNAVGGGKSRPTEIIDVRHLSRKGEPRIRAERVDMIKREVARRGEAKKPQKMRDDKQKNTKKKAGLGGKEVRSDDQGKDADSDDERGIVTKIFEAITPKKKEKVRHDMTYYMPRSSPAAKFRHEKEGAGGMSWGEAPASLRGGVFRDTSYQGRTGRHVESEGKDRAHLSEREQESKNDKHHHRQRVESEDKGKSKGKAKVRFADEDMIASDVPWSDSFSVDSSSFSSEFAPHQGIQQRRASSSSHSRRTRPSIPGKSTVGGSHARAPTEESIRQNSKLPRAPQHNGLIEGYLSPTRPISKPDIRDYHSSETSSKYHGEDTDEEPLSE